MLVSALSRALSARVVLMNLTIGLKGLLGYLKALGGSNIVKVVPSNGGASGSQTIGKRLKVICGGNTSYLDDSEWIGDKTPLTFCEVRVSPNNSVKPNIGATELAEALNRVLPFTAKTGERPVLQCVNFVAKEGKLTLISADGFRLGVVSLDYDDGEGQALIHRNDLKVIASALRRAKRARVSFEGEDVTKPSRLIIDTELIRYKWDSYGGNFPEWQRVIPTEFNACASFDTVEAIKAVNSLKGFTSAINLTIGDGKVVMANPDDKGQAELVADTDGEVGKVTLDGQQLAEALRACGGMVEVKLANAYSAVLFTSNGYLHALNPMVTLEAQEQARADRQATEKLEAEQAEAVAEPKAKGKRKGKTEPEPVTEPVAEAEPEPEPVTA